MKLTQLEKRLYCYVKRLKQQISDLEAKLAEKEKEYQNILSSSRAVVNAHIEFLENKNLMIIAELEKVKEHISKGLEFDVGVQLWFEKYIDQQIKSLKGDK